MFYAKRYISNAIRYLSLSPGFLPCSLRLFRLLTSAWAGLPVLGDDDASVGDPSLIAGQSCYQDLKNTRKAKAIIAHVGKTKGEKNE